MITNNFNPTKNHMNTIEKFKELIANIDRLKQELQENGLLECLKDLFAQYPEVKKLQFTAYTPYFNDGDECTYWCSADCPSFNGEDDEEEEVQMPEVSKAARKAFIEALSLIDDETWKDIVGDHVMVTITPAGITVADYDHE